ncbi:(2Fe-2S) ferredoxin domain-containing protein [Hymenobacter sp. ASUV-10]|uniref:(2Fe-2S) ferredoxin domain-containing protein n=1 Tax=Hymenobacter aranciens TaxID=3063996 RepID=A0ABT9BGY8_9BACT|nr:(2Fe-2S) ferredoxin domain-containing protein [Hymenobacter sp. ASUV-10]MDO7877060.1 (2Fe-2S) ferredoxin domain-containing protein [Hymenobacter sp. ASUV-10]
MSQTRRLFVCTNQKSGVGDDVAKALKKELKIQGLKKLFTGGEKQRVRVQTCNCLDLCKQCKKGPGAALIVYPEGTVYGNVRPNDAAAIVEDHLGRDRVVKRLLLEE